MESAIDIQALFDLGFVVAGFIAFAMGYSKGGQR